MWGGMVQRAQEALYPSRVFISRPCGSSSGILQSKPSLCTPSLTLQLPSWYGYLTQPEVCKPHRHTRVFRGVPEAAPQGFPQVLQLSLQEEEATWGYGVFPGGSLMPLASAVLYCKGSVAAACVSHRQSPGWRVTLGRFWLQ